jgi:hypothetical protein
VTVAGLVVMSVIAGTLAWSLRRTALWPLALPIALAFGESGFVQTWDFLVQLPVFPVPITWLDIMFVALVIAWLLVRRVAPKPKDPPSLWGFSAAPLAAWLAVVALAVPLAWIDGGVIKFGIAWIVLSYAYIPLSAVIVYDILRRSDRSAVWALLRSLSVIVSVLAVFYTLHMLGWSLYDLAGVNSTYTAVGEVRRDILTFPVWACITVPFLLWSERISLAEGCMIVVQIVAVAMSLTRSLVLACLFAIVFVVVARIAARRRPLQPLVPVSIGGVAFGVLAWSVPGFVTRTAELLLSRFDELAAGVTSVSTITQRLGVGERVSNFLSGWGMWMGAGFSDEALARSEASLGRLLVADSLWSIVLLNFGIIGAVIVALTLATGIAAGIRAAFKRRSEPLSLAIVATAALIWLSSRTIASSEIVTFCPLVCGFVIALVIAEVRGAWAAPQAVHGLLLGRDDAPALPGWLPRGVAIGVALAFVVLVEIVIGWVVAR